MALKVKRTVESVVEGLGDRIRQARKESGKRVEELAAAAKLSKAHWYDIEAEEVRDGIPEETLRRIEAALGVDLGVEL